MLLADVSRDTLCGFGAYRRAHWRGRDLASFRRLVQVEWSRQLVSVRPLGRGGGAGGGGMHRGKSNTQDCGAKWYDAFHKHTRKLT